MLSRLAAQRICGAIVRVTLKTRGVRDTLKCELGKKGVQTLDVVLFSELRKIENYVWFRRFWRSLSLRDASLGKPRECAKYLSPQAMVIPDAKAAVDKE